MGCEEIRKLILTGYVDREATDNERELVRAHTKKCKYCRELLQEAQKIKEGFSVSSGKMRPPEDLWRRIKEGIIADKEKNPDIFGVVVKKAADLIRHLRPLPAFAAVLALLFIAGITAVNGTKSYYADRGAPGAVSYREYFSELLDNTLSEGGEGFGTAIEEYFL